MSPTKREWEEWDDATHERPEPPIAPAPSRPRASVNFFLLSLIFLGAAAIYWIFAIAFHK